MRSVSELQRHLGFRIRCVVLRTIGSGSALEFFSGIRQGDAPENGYSSPKNFRKAGSRPLSASGEGSFGTVTERWLLPYRCLALRCGVSLVLDPSSKG